MLDPYSQSTLLDCNAGVRCPLNPGAANPDLTVTPADASVATFPLTSTPYDSANTFARIPMTALKTGFTAYNLGTQSTGFYNSSTSVNRQGLASVSDSNSPNYGLFIASADIDEGVGVQTYSRFTINGTTFAAFNTPFTATIADPSIAGLSSAPSTVGTASFSRIGIGQDDSFYVQGLNAGTTTITITNSGYTSRTLTVTVRPAGFTIKERNVVATVNLHNGSYYGPLATVKPAVLDAFRDYALVYLNAEPADLPAAYASIQKAVAGGLPSAKSFAAEFVQSGAGGVKQSALGTLLLYKEAADAGDINAANNLGNIYTNDEKPNEPAAIHYWQIAAAGGDDRALFNIGMDLLMGDGIKKDEKLALDHLMGAAAIGNAHAQPTMGVIYLQGTHGVAQDDMSGRLYMKAAALNDDSDAQIDYGVMLMDGANGLKKDHAAGMAYMMKAAKTNIRASQVLHDRI